MHVTFEPIALHETCDFCKYTVIFTIVLLEEVAVELKESFE